MAKNIKNYAPEFTNYQEFIVHHPNYAGIPYRRKSDGSISWVASKQTTIGLERIAWLYSHALRLGIDTSKDGWYAKTLFLLHPTKSKPCQICGLELSIDYIYLSQNLIKSVYKNFEIFEDLTIITSIFELISILEEHDYTTEVINEFLFKEFKIKSFEFPLIDKFGLPSYLARKCRNGLSTKLGPGAMSNFPDRLCGYHSYNRCCRGKHDLGRLPKNMALYSKDRRAYEYWSDGNIVSANTFMNSPYFDGLSADHIGPISLGFKHESLFMTPLSIQSNSSKRDRISYEDINTLIERESLYEVSSMSWYGKILWDYIKSNYTTLSTDTIRLALKQNVHNYMEILYILKAHSNYGIDFLYKIFIKPKENYFNYSYFHNESGVIIKKANKPATRLLGSELSRLSRVSLTSLDNYHQKSIYNRNLKISLNSEDKKILDLILQLIDVKKYEDAFSQLIKLIENKQYELINAIR